MCGHAMVQDVKSQPVVIVALAHSQVSISRIYGGKSGTVIGFSPRTAVFPCQYHSTNTRYSFINLSSALCSINS